MKIYVCNVCKKSEAGNRVSGNDAGRNRAQARAVPVLR